MRKLKEYKPNFNINKIGKFRFYNQLLLGLVGLSFLSCSTTVKHFEPREISKNQFVNHYVNDANLDTLGYRFHLKDLSKYVPILTKKELKTWTEKELIDFENKMESINSLNDLDFRDRAIFERNIYNYSLQGNQLERYKKLLELNKRIPLVSTDFISSYSDSNEFDLIDNWIINGDSILKQQALTLVYNKLSTSLPREFSKVAPLLVNENSDIYYNTLKQLVRNTDTVVNTIKRENLTRDIMYDVLPEIARVGGEKAIPFMLQCIEGAKKDTPKKDGFYMDMFKKNAEFAFRRLVKFNTVSDKGKANIIKTLKKHQINITELTPNNNLEIYDIDAIIDKANEAKLIDYKLTKLQKYRLSDYYCSDFYNLEVEDILKLLKLTFSYTTNPYSRIGHFSVGTKRYGIIMRDFMDVAMLDLPDFDVKLLKNRGAYSVKLLLGSKKEAYIVTVTDEKKQDFNHEAITQLFNVVLENNKIDKRFQLSLSDDGYNMNVVYEKPNAINNFLISIGKENTKQQHK